MTPPPDEVIVKATLEKETEMRPDTRAAGDGDVPTITPLFSSPRDPLAAWGVGELGALPPLPLERPEANDRLERCVRIWGLAHRGVWFYPEAMREVMYVEQGLPVCESCRLRSGTINDRGIRVCGSCKNMPNGDDIDREWSRYKEEGP